MKLKIKSSAASKSTSSSPSKSIGPSPSKSTGLSPSKSSGPSPSKSTGSQRRSTRIQTISTNKPPSTINPARKVKAETQPQKLAYSQSKAIIKPAPKVKAVKVKAEKQLVTVGANTQEGDAHSDANTVSNVYITCCRPAGLCKIIAELNDSQKEAVKEIGFGGLLDLKLTVIPHVMLREIIYAFRSRIFFEISETEKFELTEDDVCDVFGLPNTGPDLDLVITGTASSGSTGDTLKRAWRQKYGITDNKSAIQLGKVSEKLLACKEADDEFKKAFVLYAMSSFLAPTSGTALDLRLLSAVEDVSKIRQWNWCRFVFHELQGHVRDALRGRSYIRVCVVLLAVAYFHRYLLRGDNLSNELPLIQHWDDAHFSQRLQRENNDGGLGTGKRSATLFPISRKNLDGCGTGGHSPRSGEGRSIVLDVPVNIRTDEEIHSAAIDDVHELILLNERDFELFCNRYLERANKIRLKMQAVSVPSSCKEPSQVAVSAADARANKQPENVDDEGSQKVVGTPSFFTDQVIRQLDEHVKEVLSLRATNLPQQNVSKQGTATNLTRSPVSKEARPEDVVIEAPTFNLFSQFYENCVRLSGIEATAIDKEPAQQTPIIKQQAVQDIVEESPMSLDAIMTDVCADIQFNFGDVAREGEDVDDNVVVAEKARKGEDVDDEVVADSEDVVVEDYLVDITPDDVGKNDGGTTAVLEGSEVRNIVTGLCDAELKDVSVAIPTIDPPQHCSDGGSEQFVTAEEAELVMSSTAELLLGAATEVENLENSKKMDNAAVLEDISVGCDGVPEGNCPDDSNPPVVGDAVPEENVVLQNDVVLEDNAVGDVPGNNIRTSYLLHSATHEGLMSVVPENFGCDMYCGEVDPDLVVLSTTMISMKHIFTPMLSVRKQVADYCYLHDNDIPISDNLVTWGVGSYLNREDMETMLPNKMIMIGVIEWWSLFLNEICISGSPTILFFGLGQQTALDQICMPPKDVKFTRSQLVSDVKAALNLCLTTNKKACDVNSDLIFVPILLDEHYSCLCINFNAKRVEYLDNVYQEEMFNDGQQDSLRLMYCQTLLSIMSEYLVERGVERGVDVRDYKIVNVPFSWQTPEIENLDCGVYMMLHMLFYRGSVFDCDLGNADSRVLYRAEICALLVLSDMNESRADVIATLSQLKSIRKETLTTLEEKRRVNALEESNSQKGKKRKSVGRVKTVGKKIRTTQPVVHSPATSSVTSGHEGCVNTPTPSHQLESMSADSAMSPKSLLGSRKRGKSDDGLGCSLNCGEEDNTVVLLSDFMKKNRKLFSKMRRLRKQVLDMVFRNDADFKPTEIFVVYNSKIGMFLDRQDIVSILPTNLMTSRVVECWSTLLNSLEFDQRSEPTSMFFGLRHMQDALISLLENYDALSPVQSQSTRLFASWDFFISSCEKKCVLNSDLIFVPLLYDDHYACVCINYIYETVDLLDNTYHKEEDSSDFMKLAEIVANHMSSYLETKNIMKSKDCRNFEVVDVKFNWKKKEKNNEESGCFMLYTMAEYGGSVFESDLHNKICRRSYCAEIAASLLLADINEYRSLVIGNVKECQTRRPKMLGLAERTKKSKTGDGVVGLDAVPLTVVFPADLD